MTREEAIKKLERLKNEFLDEYIDYDGTTSAYDMAIEALQEPERKKGKWILCENPIYFSPRIGAADPYLCSACDMKNDRQTKYCPNCGAKMDEVE